MLELKRIFSVIAKNRILFLLGAVGLLLLLFSGTGAKESTIQNPLDAAEKYRTALEEEIASVCEDVRGVGNVRVLLTLATTEIALYEKNLGKESETVALSGGDGILLAYEMPRIAGVSVVCQGGGDATVRQELTALLCRALDLPTNAVHISPLK